MLIRIECREVNGWPMMFALPLVTQSGDKVRIQNYGLERYNNFKAVCDKQRELTRLAKEGKSVRTPATFGLLVVEAVLGKPLEDIINEEVDKKTKQLQAEVESLKAKIKDLESK